MRLVEQGIYKPVKYSDQALPIVLVRKNYAEIRVCGDYKTTVNPRANCVINPVTKTEDLLAALNGGQKFSKIDLEKALQLCLGEKFREYLTVNTHKGLFRPTCMMFRLHSAAGVFQREIEKRLNGIPGVVLRCDNILITGVNDADHLRKAGFSEVYE